MNKTNRTETMNDYLSKIPEDVRPRLLDAIRSLLRAGCNCGKVAALLSPQASFGKYDGCHPKAIQEIAVHICKQMNAEVNGMVKEAFDRNFPAIARRRR